jgi:hypothetical protein
VHGCKSVKGKSGTSGDNVLSLSGFIIFKICWPVEWYNAYGRSERSR